MGCGVSLDNKLCQAHREYEAMVVNEALVITVFTCIRIEAVVMNN